MSDDITVVSPSGGLVVDTVRLLRRSGRLLEVALHCRLARGAVDLADGAVPTFLLSAAGAPPVAYSAESCIDRLRDALERAETVAESLGLAVAGAAVAYAAAEDAAALAVAGAAWQLGSIGRLAMPGLLTAGALAAAGWAVVGRLDGDRDAGAGIGAFLRSMPRITSNRVLATTVRIASENLDEFLAGLAGLPPGVVIAGDENLGIVGPQQTAGLIASLGTVGLFRESDVTVTRLSTESGSTGVPSLEDLAGRLPTFDADERTRVRIERYRRPGEPDGYIVYIAGTSEWSPTGSDDPMDLTSNIVAMAGRSAASERAVRQAMRQAGVTAANDVVFVGHSQGGLIAHELAASGDYSTVGVLEIGSPADQSRLEADIPDIRLLHPEDVVPAIGGRGTTVDVIHGPWDDSVMAPDGEPVTAHAASHYLETARLADQSGDARIGALKTAIAGVTGGATAVTVQRFGARRSR
ncbi:MAG: hypothetical protein QM635_04240 [Microbacteriaceae bacterium]